jgi:hypothetical protein
MYRTQFLKYFSIGFIMVFLAHHLHAQDEKLKAIFVYNYTRYINWPQKQGDFVIYVLGRSPIIAEFQDLATKKKVGNSNIVVKTVISPEEIAEGQIVYIASAKTNALPILVPKSQDYNMLIITEKEDACKSGAGINFINKDGKLTFEISRANITRCGLTVSTSLFSLGTEVKE